MLYRLSVKSQDELYHIRLYDWMINNNLTEELLQVHLSFFITCTCWQLFVTIPMIVTEMSFILVAFLIDFIIIHWELSRSIGHSQQLRWAADSTRYPLAILRKEQELLLSCQDSSQAGWETRVWLQNTWHHPVCHNAHDPSAWWCSCLNPCLKLLMVLNFKIFSEQRRTSLLVTPISKLFVDCLVEIWYICYASSILYCNCIVQIGVFVVEVTYSCQRE